MHDLNSLRDTTSADIVNAIYDAVERNKDVLDSDSYGDLMNSLLVMHERLHPACEGATRNHPHVVQVLGNVQLVSEEDRDRKIYDTLEVKHMLERDMVEYRRMYRAGREVLDKSHENILKTLYRLERLPITPVRDNEPIVL
jgi:hypothetical protein